MAVLNKSHGKVPADAVYIGRPSKWGNPFVMYQDGLREEIVQKYANWIMSNETLLDDLHELKGKDLVCWCAPKLCHGHILEELVSRLETKESNDG